MDIGLVMWLLVWLYGYWFRYNVTGLCHLLLVWLYPLPYNQTSKHTLIPVTI